MWIRVSIRADLSMVLHGLSAAGRHHSLDRPLATSAIFELNSVNVISLLSLQGHQPCLSQLAACVPFKLFACTVFVFTSSKLKLKQHTQNLLDGRQT